jgi:arsenite methyltransferase
VRDPEIARPDVVDQRREVVRALALRPGEHVVDIGAGPGFLAVEMAAALGRDGRCTPSTRATACAPSPRHAPDRLDGAPVEIADGSAHLLQLPDSSVC